MENVTLGERARVSVIERLVPALGWALAALSGVAGMVTMRTFFDSLRKAETAGLATFFGGLSQIEGVMGGVLAVAAVLGAAAVVVSAIRMFVATKTAAPPGSLTLLVALFSMVPPALILYSIKISVGAAMSPTAGLVAVAETVSMLIIAAAAIGVLAVPVLLAFAFVPFKARTGRKPTTLISLLLAEAALVAIAAWYFVEMFAARQEMMLH